MLCRTLAAGEPLFVGNGADVLKAIFDHCGTPTAENWPGHEKLEYYDELVDTRFRKPPQLIRKLHDRFPRLLSYVFC